MGAWAVCGWWYFSLWAQAANFHKVMQLLIMIFFVSYIYNFQPPLWAMVREK